MSVTNASTFGRAAVAASRRVSVIWVIPVVAIAIGVWLAWSTLSREGPTITLSLDSAEGLQAGQSQLKFKEITLGTVRSISLTSDHTHVLVTVGTTAAAAPLLRDTTVFWVVKPRLFAGNLSGLSTLFSGSYIAMLPGRTAGKPARNFAGLEDPPVLQAAIPGRTFLLKSQRLGSVSVGSPVFFRDLSVGEVLGWDIGEMAENVTVHVFVRAPFDQYVNDETRFWNVSGVSVKLAGGGLDVQVESLRAILLGGIAFYTPGANAKPTPSLENHLFPLFADREAAESASYSRKIPLVTYFPGSVAGLSPGSDVTMHGLKVGKVTDVRLTYDPAKDVVLAPVRFEVEPERVLGVGKQLYKTTAQGAQVLLNHGLHASLQSANLLTGQQVLTLEFVATTLPTPLVMQGSDIVVPATEGGGLGGIEAAAGALLEKVNSIPFEAIGTNLGQLTQNLNGVSNSPEVKETLTSLAATMTTLQSTVQKLDTGVTPAAQRLPEIATELQRTLANANGLLTSFESGYGDNTKLNRDLESLLVQLNDATRSIRSLADLLTRHPEALIRGRPQSGFQ